MEGQQGIVGFRSEKITLCLSVWHPVHEIPQQDIYAGKIVSLALLIVCLAY